MVILGTFYHMNESFRKFAQLVSDAAGSSWAFLIAFFTIIVWAISGPIFHFSETWQLVINTGTTIITFLMIFLVQNAQNRDARATHLKLDELIRAVKGAQDKLIDAEDLPEEELEKDKEKLVVLSKKRQTSKRGKNNREKKL